MIFKREDPRIKNARQTFERMFTIDGPVDMTIDGVRIVRNGPPGTPVTYEVVEREAP